MLFRSFQFVRSPLSSQFHRADMTLFVDYLRANYAQPLTCFDRIARCMPPDPISNGFWEPMAIDGIYVPNISSKSMFDRIAACVARAIGPMRSTSAISGGQWEEMSTDGIYIPRAKAKTTWTKIQIFTSVALLGATITFYLVAKRGRHLLNLMYSPKYTPKPSTDPRPFRTAYRKLILDGDFSVSGIISLPTLESFDAIAVRCMLCFGLVDKQRVEWHIDHYQRFGTEHEFQTAISPMIEASNKVERRTTVRNAFKNTRFEPVKITSAHTHPAAAAERNAQVNFMRTVGNKCGLKLFMEQSSEADYRKGIQGSRTHYWAKDIPTTVRREIPRGPTLIGMVDVDYYIDMPAYLAKNTHPVIIYTIQPTAPSGEMKDTVFKFKENYIHTAVAGGATFSHQLWNYGEDHITCTINDTFESQEEMMTTVYLIERIQVSPHRQIVLLCPVGHWTGFEAKVATLLQSKTLVRFEPLIGESNVIRSVREENGETIHEVSIADDDTYTSVTIPAAVYDTLVATAKNSSTKLAGCTIESHLPRDSQHSKRDAQIIRNHINHYQASNLFVFPVEQSVIHYSFKPQEYDQDKVKHSNHPFATPIIGYMSASPDRCKANEERSIEARVNGVKHTKPLPITPFLENCIREFIELVIPDEDAHTYSPVDYEYVRENQARPTQQRTLDEADLAGENYSTTVKAFMKADTSGKYADPRNISTICPRDKYEYSALYYSVSFFLKTNVWYTFGKKPIEIAKRVATICENADDYVLLGDYSRMDGRVSNVGRELTTRLMMRLFRPCYHERLERLTASQINRFCVSTHGVKYFSDMTRLSGSPETSGHNTLENAFIAYLGFRMSKHPKSGEFYTPSEAYAKLCSGVEVGGDDGIMADLPAESYKKAAAALGHSVTLSIVKVGDSGVNFLSRYYGPNVWYGDPTSMCDLLRTLRKFHLTTDPNADPVEKFKEKALAVVFTDANTPIIGRYARGFLEAAEVKIPTSISRVSPDTSWWAASFDQTCQFPNEWDEWMSEHAVEALPDFDWEAFLAWKPTTVEEYLNAPCFTPLHPLPPPEVPVVANGEHVLPEEKGPAPEEVDTEEPPAPQPENSKPKRARRKRHAREDSGESKYDPTPIPKQRPSTPAFTIRRLGGNEEQVPLPTKCTNQERARPMPGRTGRPSSGSRGGRPPRPFGRGGTVR